MVIAAKFANKAPANIPVIGVNKALGLGQKPELKWISLNEMFIDDSYQRNTESKASQKNIAQIKAEFSWEYCGALTVCFVAVKKKYAIIDGQHRFLAAKLRSDIVQLPCVVFKIDKVEQQAKNFFTMNKKRVNINTLADFHAACAAGDTDANSLKQLMKEINITIPKSPAASGQTGAREVQSPSTLLRMLGKYSKKQIQWALNIIPEAYGEEKGMLRVALIKAMASFIKIHVDADRGTMLKVLADTDPKKLEDDARAAQRISGGGTQNYILEAIDRKYKSFLRKEK